MASKGKPSQSEDDDAPANRRGEHLSLNEHGNGGWRVDPPGQEGNEHSQRPDGPPGQNKEPEGSVQEGTDEPETLAGAEGDDSLSGAGGDDSLAGGAGADTLSGGEGGDTFGGGALDESGDLDQVVDFLSGEDKLTFEGGAAPAADNYAEGAAADYAEALAAAQAAFAGGDAYFAAEVPNADGTGTDVIIFADTDGDPATAEAAIVLVGQTLDGVSDVDLYV
jgi:Ca2+-binding RTX toxin-like protein